MDSVGFGAIGDLSCHISVIEALAVGKQGVCGHCLINPSYIHMGKLDMACLLSGYLMIILAIWAVFYNVFMTTGNGLQF